ncbi:TPA: type II toxin-antitoxin system HipA family toxin [Vibrio parahaemolyticus]|nr:type II toxin-antitoxin system HipA family toxin [Vibrio parahaemolyticus]
METLTAYMNNELVGTLAQYPDNRLSFKYDSSWLNNDNARPLSLSLRIQKNTISSEAVFNYFDNLLPDSPDTRSRLSARFKTSTTQPFDLLTAVGRDVVGALTLLPPDTKNDKPGLEYEILDEKTLELILSALQAGIPHGMIEESNDFRIAIAGAQAKTALLKVDSHWCLPSGNTPTTHIIKLPMGILQQPHCTLDLTDSVENEYLCIELARELGFDVPNIEIIQTLNFKALAVERFDRKWTNEKTHIQRLPQEDMCQAASLPASIKYESDGGIGILEIMNLLSGSSNAFADQYNFMKFQVYQWVIGATDGHAKNYSITIEPSGSYRLTPFYDILSAYPLLGKKGLNIRQLKLAMGLRASRGRKYEVNKIYPRHFLATAQYVRFEQDIMQEILDTMKTELPEAIDRLNTRLSNDFPEHVSSPIFDNALKMLKRLSLKTMI